MVKNTISTTDLTDCVYYSYFRCLWLAAVAAVAGFAKEGQEENHHQQEQQSKREIEEEEEEEKVGGVSEK